MYYNIIDLKPVECKVHERVMKRHPELTEDDVRHAWKCYVDGAVRRPDDVVEVRIGFDREGRELEMVGTMTPTGWVVFHAMTPPTRKTRMELKAKKRRM